MQKILLFCFFKMFFISNTKFSTKVFFECITGKDMSERPGPKRAGWLYKSLGRDGPGPCCSQPGPARAGVYLHVVPPLPPPLPTPSSDILHSAF